MKQFIFPILISLMMLFCLPVYGHVRLLTPVDGTVMVVGGTVTISWQLVQAHEQNNWDLYFSTDGGSNWSPLQLDISKDEFSYNWVVPDNITTQARIKIVQDNVDMNYEDMTENFTIQSGTVEHFKILSPFGGSELNAGEFIYISWQVFQSLNQNNWDLYLSTDNGSSWNPIQLDIPNNQLNHKWTIPNNATAEAKIKLVQDNTGDNFEEITEAFTIKSGATAINIIDNESPDIKIVNYPNPINFQKHFFSLELKKRNNVLLEIYSIQGKKVETVINRVMEQGNHDIQWDASKYTNGVYLFRLITGKTIAAKKFMIFK